MCIASSPEQEREDPIVLPPIASSEDYASDPEVRFECRGFRCSSVVFVKPRVRVPIGPGFALCRSGMLSLLGVVSLVLHWHTLRPR
jgi:hypothetical protein